MKLYIPKELLEQAKFLIEKCRKDEKEKPKEDKPVLRIEIPVRN